MANVSKFLVECHAPRIDSGSVEKLRKDAKMHQELATRIHAIQEKFKTRKPLAREPAQKEISILARMNGAQYRIKITESDIQKIEHVTRCEFCIPSIKEGNFLALFKKSLQDGEMQKITLKDFMSPLIAIGSKIGGIGIDKISSVSIIDYQDSGILATIRGAGNNIVRLIFKLHGGIYKMNIIVRVNDRSNNIVISADK